MISWLLFPLPLWARIIFWVIALAIIGTACAIWLFPYIQTFIPIPDDATVGSG